MQAPFMPSLWQAAKALLARACASHGSPGANKSCLFLIKVSKKIHLPYILLRIKDLCLSLFAHMGQEKPLRQIHL